MSDVDERTYRIKPRTVLARPTGDRVVMLDPELGHYLSLNTTGSCVWGCLEAGSTFDEMVDQLTAAFEIGVLRGRGDGAAHISR